MDRRMAEIVADVDAWSFDGSADELDRLDGLVTEYFERPDAGEHVEAWFRLYERNPEDESRGVFWSILHGLEGLPTYAAAVVASVRRRATEFPVMMLHRMLNADIRTFDGVDLLALLKGVADDDGLPIDIREDARRFVQHQHDRGTA